MLIPYVLGQNQSNAQQSEQSNQLRLDYTHIPESRYHPVRQKKSQKAIIQLNEKAPSLTFSSMEHHVIVSILICLMAIETTEHRFHLQKAQINYSIKERNILHGLVNEGKLA